MNGLKVQFLCIVCVFLFMLSACGKSTITLTQRQTLYLAFKNSSGDNLIITNGLRMDTFINVNSTTMFLNKGEYSLTVKSNNGPQVEGDPIYYNSQYQNMLTFDYASNWKNLVGKKHDLTYEYSFVCPKLFGDNNARIIKVLFKIKAKGAYYIREVYFDNQPVVIDYDFGTVILTS